MKSFKIPTFLASLFGLCLLSGLDAPSAHADFTFGEPVNLESVIPFVDAAHDTVDCFSSDGLEAYVESDRPGGCGTWDVWVSKRASTADAWGPLENLGAGVNSQNNEGYACISTDGFALYFPSNRPGGYGGFDIYMTTRATKNAPWGSPVNLGSKINSSAYDGDPWISPDGLELYFNSNRPGGYGGWDLHVAKRATTNDPWGEPLNLGPVVNSTYNETSVALSPDGLLLLFCDQCDYGPPRPGGYGREDMWVARRATLSSPWQAPVNLGPKVNRSGADVYPRILPDGSRLYFSENRGGVWNNWQIPIIPIVDFNGDGIVDLVDLVMLIENWGTNNTLYDIGPFAWGDGKVDIEDLKVFIAEWEKQNPPGEPTPQPPQQ